MSSVPFGVDLGNNNTVIAVAKNRGIDIVVNEVSNRATPTVVGFGRKNRFIGETGKNQQTSNLKNTAENIKRILGLEYDHPDFQHESKFFSTELVKNKDGGISSKVRFLNEPTEFSSTQLVGMYLNKIKDTAAKDVKGTIHDICLAVPIWYTEQMRRAAHDACILAGLNPVRIVNDLTAAAVGYGVFKTDISEEAKKVAFVDMGHSSYSVAIAEVKKGELKVLGSASDKHFGGRDFDRAITEHFADVFKDKYKFNIRENGKAYQRVLVAAEKLKKVLSANSQAPFNVESVMNDVDASGQLSRQELEEMVQPLLEKLADPVEQALKLANVTKEEIDFVEVIGGCTRVPAIKERISQVFNQKLSFTLNQDEAIAKGAAFICAMHSPTMRVRPFKFEDVNPYSVSYFWEKDAEDVDHMEVFPRGGLFPSTKLITLYRSQDFEVEAKYTKMEELPKGTNPFIAKWTIKGVVPNEGEESIACKIKLRNDPSGFYTIESAHTVEEKEVQELVENPEAAEDAEPEYKTVKKLVKKNDLVLEASTLSYPADVLNSLIEQENRMLMDDKLVADTEDRKNALEEYIYTLRGKLDEEYKDFASDEEKEKLGQMLLKAEDWLYDEGFDSTKAKYIAKYEELASIGNIIRGRYLAKEEEKKQSILSKQEAKKAAEIAEKMAAERSARQNPEQPKEEPKKDADEMDLD